MNNLVNIDPLIKCTEIKNVINLPVIIRVNKFDDESVEKFSESMNEAHLTGQPVIPIVIDSYGGRVHGLFSMAAVIESSKLPVATICVGKAMSCGMALLTCGSEGYRYISKDSDVLVHDITYGFFGKDEDIQAEAHYTRRLKNRLFNFIARNCGHPADYFLKMIREANNTNVYLSSRQALKHNIVNHIGVPSLTTNIKVETIFEG